MHRLTVELIVSVLEGFAKNRFEKSGNEDVCELLFPGLPAPALSHGCCRHTSMHHTLVKAPLLHPPSFRRESTPRSHHTCTYALADTLANALHAEEGEGSYTQIHTHTHPHGKEGPRMRTSSRYGDKSRLGWLPICESRHGAVVQVICLPPDGSAGRPKGFISCARGGFMFESRAIQLENAETWCVFVKLWGGESVPLQRRS